MGCHAQKCVERTRELAHKPIDQLHKVCTFCLYDHRIKPEDVETAGVLLKIWSQIASECMYLARFGRPDLQWTVDPLARSVTKWSRACD